METIDLEANIIRSIKESTTEVFSTMLMLDVTSDESFIKDENKVTTDLISSLHFFGEKYMGKIAIFAYGATACQLTTYMLGIETTVVDDDVRDCMGEIANMIAGNAKTKLESTMGELYLLTPWVVAGRNLTIASPSGGEAGLSIESQAQFSWIMTKFTYDKGHFVVGVQPNQVPQNNTFQSVREKKINELQEEIMDLNKEIASLKSTINQTRLVV